MTIRKATYEDVLALMQLFERAKAIMRASGNMNQWGSGYPSSEVVRGDIDRGVCYVVSDSIDGEIEATMAFIPMHLKSPQGSHLQRGRGCSLLP
jgi:hypothetical protein